MIKRKSPSIWLILVSIYILGVFSMLAMGLRNSPNALSAELADRPEVMVRPTSEMTTLLVEPGRSATDIALSLEQANVIDNKFRFTMLIELTGWAPELRAGRYEFRRGTPVLEVIRRLREGSTNEKLVQVPEGMRLEEIGNLLEEQGIVSRWDWEAALSGPRPERILANRPSDATLIGYLLPASYPVYEKISAEDLVAAMITALSAALSDELLTEIQTSEWSIHDVLTLASIVEKEAVDPSEQPFIASVFLNRLELGMALQADPTVQFATASFKSGGTGWWPEIFYDDLERDSPYNTYRYPGLPPGPISNPGIGTIIATIHAAETDYLYFVARCDGSNLHDFARTLEEHSVNVARCHGD